MNPARRAALASSSPSGRRAGILIPLSAIPSTRSWGIGELPDVDGRDDRGAVLALQRLSAMALDPIFISLADLEDSAGEAALGPAERAELARVRIMASVDFETVRRVKTPALLAAYRRFRHTECHRRSGRRRDFETYREAQAWWLEDYALFRAFHARHSELPWTSWPEELRSRDARALAQEGRARRPAPHAVSVFSSTATGKAANPAASGRTRRPSRSPRRCPRSARR